MKTNVQSTKSGAGGQFLLPDCRARACVKGGVCSVQSRHDSHAYMYCLRFTIAACCKETVLSLPRAVRQPSTVSLTAYGPDLS